MMSTDPPQAQADRSAVDDVPGAEADRMLLQFVHERDIACPQCGYNLRNLTRTACPECHEVLRLTVGLVKAHFEWFVVTIIPGAFSGICAIILAMPIIMVPITGGGPAPIPIILLDAFGWLSGLVAVGLFLARHRFLRMSRNHQIAWAATMWAVHLSAFGIVVLIPFLL